MRVILSIFILLALVGVLIADGACMYGAHRQAVNFSAQAVDQAAQTYVDTKGDQDAVHRTIQDMATTAGVELTDLSYHKGTTRWYQVTVEVESGGVLLKHLPYVKDYLAQKSTSVEHF
jgi:hypothetical protein